MKSSKRWAMSNIGSEGGNIYYFTSDIRYKIEKPKTIEQWLKKFDTREIILVKSETINLGNNI